MTKDEVKSVLTKCLDKGTDKYDVPTDDDWRILEAYFNTKFPQDFKAFIDLMADFSFPGDIYNVMQSGRTNGNDDIKSVYESELSLPDWPKQLVPFCGIGNGDYFMINSTEREKSAVYYRHHENGAIEKYASSFEEWLKQLPSYLNGE